MEGSTLIAENTTYDTKDKSSDHLKFSETERAMKGWQRWQSSNEMTHPRNVSAHLKTDDLDLDVKSLTHAFASLTSESGSVLLIDRLLFLFKTVFSKINRL